MASLAENLIRLQEATEDIANAITEKGGVASYSDGLEAMGDKIRAISNSYSAADEGKVVSNGALVAQGSDEVTENGTVDTTLISSLLVNVQGGGTGVPVKLTTTNENIISSDLYIVDAGSYIYIYGEVVAPGGNGARDVLFDIPQSFSIDTVGNLIESGYHQYGTSNVWLKDRIRISKTSKCIYFNGSNSSKNPPSSSDYLKNTMHMFGIYEKS